MSTHRDRVAHRAARGGGHVRKLAARDRVDSGAGSGEIVLHVQVLARRARWRPRRGGRVAAASPSTAVTSHHALLRVLHQATVRNVKLRVLVVHRAQEREAVVEEGPRASVRVRDEAGAVLHRGANRQRC